MVLRPRGRGRVGHRRLLLRQAPSVSRRPGPRLFFPRRRERQRTRRTALASLTAMHRTLALALGVAAGAYVVREHRKRAAAERFAAAALETLLNAVEANDPQTGAHVRRVAAYALILADAAQLGPRETRAVERV